MIVWFALVVPLFNLDIEKTLWLSARYTLRHAVDSSRDRIRGDLRVIVDRNTNVVCRACVLQ